MKAAAAGDVVARMRRRQRCGKLTPVVRGNTDITTESRSRIPHGSVTSSPPSSEYGHVSTLTGSAATRFVAQIAVMLCELVEKLSRP